MEIVRITDGPRRVQGGIGAPEHDLVCRCRLMVKDSEENIKDGKRGEGTVDVALARASFRIEGEVADAL